MSLKVGTLVLIIADSEPHPDYSLIGRVGEITEPLHLDTSHLGHTGYYYTVDVPACRSPDFDWLFESHELVPITPPDGRITITREDLLVV